jgi:hypothetical protein
MTEAARQRANTAFMIRLAALVASTGTLTRSLRVQVSEWVVDERRPRSCPCRDRTLADASGSCLTPIERVDAKRDEPGEPTWQAGAIVDVMPRARRRCRALPDAVLAWFAVPDVERWADPR